MVFLKKYRFEILIVLVLISAFFVTRLTNILSLPIFTDEALYVRWAQIAKNDANWRFISLTDGKQPSFIWFAMIAMRFIHDPLLAARLVSVGAGLMSMVGLFFLGRELFKNRWVGILSLGLYVFYPFALVYDRMALYDSLVGVFTLWGLYFTVLLARKVRLDSALLLGMTVGGAVLTKTNGFFTLYLLPFSLLIFDWKKKERASRFFYWMVFATIIPILTYGIYSILRLSPFYYIIEEKNALFVYPFSEWIKHPFYYFLENWKGLWNWFITYFTLPMLLLIIYSFFVAKTYLREKILLLLWFILPLIALALFGNTLYPRFIFFMTLSLLPLVSLSIVTLQKRIKNTSLLGAIFLLIIFLWLRADYFIINNFSSAPIPGSDRNQYNNDWPAGTGVKEAVTFFSKEAEKQKIYIATEGTFGLMPHALEIYLVDNPNITIKGFWPIEDMPPSEVIEKSKVMSTYFLFYQSCAPCKGKGEAPRSWPLRQIFQIEHVNKGNFLTVYKVEPPK